MLVEKKSAALGVLEVYNFRGRFHLLLHLELISLFKINQSSLIKWKLFLYFIEKIKVPHFSNYINFWIVGCLGLRS